MGRINVVAEAQQPLINLWEEGQVPDGFPKYKRLRSKSSQPFAGDSCQSNLFLNWHWPTAFLAIPFASQRGFQASFFSRWHIEGMTLYFADDVFLLHFAFEPAERAFQRLVIAELNFCQRCFTCLSIMAILELTSAAAGL